MPQLPSSRLNSSFSKSRPIPTRVDKFIDNPAHTQSLSAYADTAGGQQSQELESTVAFWLSNSKIRDSKVAPVVLPVRSEPFDGKPVMGESSGKRFVTDNLQSHAPPQAPEGKEYVLEPEQFAFAFVEPPKYRLVSKQNKPSFLQTPAERQKRLLQETLGNKAQKQLKSDNGKETRLKQKMLWEYQRGALGVESSYSDGSEIFSDSLKGITDKRWQKQQRAEIKMNNLVSNLSRVQYTKYDPLKDGEEAGPYTGPDKWFQTKTRVIPDKDRETPHNSFDRSVKTHDIRPVNFSRTQHIRNCQTAGRQYDPISGVQIDCIPPTRPEQYENQALRQVHASLNQHPAKAYNPNLIS